MTGKRSVCKLVFLFGVHAVRMPSAVLTEVYWPQLAHTHPQEGTVCMCCAAYAERVSLLQLAHTEPQQGTVCDT